MDEADLRLDGNAAAGLLAELFGAEMTLALSVCRGCGAAEPLGALVVYHRCPGLVARCAHCGRVQLRVARDAGRLWIDLGGVRSLELREADDPTWW